MKLLWKQCENVSLNVPPGAEPWVYRRLKEVSVQCLGAQSTTRLFFFLTAITKFFSATPGRSSSSKIPLCSCPAENTVALPVNTAECQIFPSRAGRGQKQSYKWKKYEYCTWEHNSKWMILLFPSNGRVVLTSHFYCPLEVKNVFVSKLSRWSDSE